MNKFFLLACTLFISGLSIAQPANDQEIKLLIDRHNFWRADVGVEQINYSQDLAKVADKWAQQLKADGCAFKHSNNSYGENLFKGTEGYYTAADAVDSWASEKQDYDYEKNKCAPGKICGHYTQIVWKNTTEVGCAKVICNGSVTWVCNYSPPGNYIGQKPY